MIQPAVDQFLVLALGLAGLWVGTQWVVNSGVRLARRLDVSDVFLGLTLLAFGTDLPEVLVAVDGAIHNLRGEESSGIVVGNAVGSSVSQIVLVLGVSALIRYVAVGRSQLKIFAVELVASTLLLFLLALDGTLSRLDGAVLLVTFAVYLVAIFNRRHREEGAEVPDDPGDPLWLEVVRVMGGLLVVVFSSELTVDKALELSRLLSLRQSFVGAVLVGLGTSLPEMAISVRAALHRQTGLSLGNIVGSNIFDMLVPIGLAGTLTPLLVDETILYFDLPFLMGGTLLVIFFLARKRGLQRSEGAVLIVVYAAYAVIRYLL